MHPTASTTGRPVEVVIKIEKPSFRCLYFTFVDGRPAWTEHRREAQEFPGHSEEAARLALVHHAHTVPCLPPEPAVETPGSKPLPWLPYKDPED